MSNGQSKLAKVNPKVNISTKATRLSKFKAGQDISPIIANIRQRIKHQETSYGKHKLLKQLLKKHSTAAPNTLTQSQSQPALAPNLGGPTALSQSLQGQGSSTTPSKPNLRTRWSKLQKSQKEETRATSKSLQTTNPRLQSPGKLREIGLQEHIRQSDQEATDSEEEERQRMEEVRKKMKMMKERQQHHHHH